MTTRRARRDTRNCRRKTRSCFGIRTARVCGTLQLSRDGECPRCCPYFCFTLLFFIQLFSPFFTSELTIYRRLDKGADKIPKSALSRNYADSSHGKILPGIVIKNFSLPCPHCTPFCVVNFDEIAALQDRIYFSSIYGCAETL